MNAKLEARIVTASTSRGAFVAPAGLAAATATSQVMWETELIERPTDLRWAGRYPKSQPAAQPDVVGGSLRLLTATPAFQRSTQRECRPVLPPFAALTPFCASSSAR